MGVRLLPSHELTLSLLRAFTLGLILTGAGCTRESSEQPANAGAVGAASGNQAASGAQGAAPSPSAPTACAVGRPRPAAGYRVVPVYFACDRGSPGTLYPVYRSVPDSLDPLVAAVGELVRGPSAAEASAGFRSYFSPATQNILRSARRSADGDTLFLDFADWRQMLPDDSGVRSFLRPGVLADLTWTVFKYQPDRVVAVRFAIEGDEATFWRWVAPDASGARPRAFTRSDWERT